MSVSLGAACVFGHVTHQQLFFSDCSLTRPSSTSFAAGFCAKKESFPVFMVFLLPGLQTIFCSICTLKTCVNCEIFFHKFVLQFGTYKLY